VKRAIGTTDSLLASGGAEASRGPISSRINAQCYPNLQAATAAAIRANQPLWVPAGTYRLTRELVIDYAPLAHSGLQVISDGAVIDATATGQPALTIRCSGGTADNPKACFYFHIRGTLFVNANTAGPTVRFGRDDFSDAHNSARIEHLAVNNAGTGYAVELNYVLERRHLRRRRDGRVGGTGHEPGTIQPHLRRRLCHRWNRDVDPERLQLREHDPGDRPRSR